MSALTAAEARALRAVVLWATAPYDTDWLGDFMRAKGCGTRWRETVKRAVRKLPKEARRG